MLELSPARAAVVRCFADARALDAFPSLGAVPGRVAADELWLFGAARSGPDIARRATSYLAGADPDGLVVDHGEAWCAWTVSGDETVIQAAFARLAEFPLPTSAADAFLQGAVAQLPAKILWSRAAVHLIIPVQLGHHVAERFRDACGDLGLTPGNERELAVQAAG